MINSRQKGKRIEREAAQMMTSLGYPSKRGQQNRGGDDSPDIIVEGLEHVHFEIKGDQSIDIGNKAWGDAIEQARRDCGKKHWVVLWKRNRTKWRLTSEYAGMIFTIDEHEILHYLDHLENVSQEL